MSSNKGIGQRYQKETFYSRLSMMAASVLPRTKRTEPYKQYGAAKATVLQQPEQLPKADFWAAVAARRSQRRFSQKPLSLEQLSLLVFATQGITGRQNGYLFRAAPSAGALYPIETYLCINRVAEIESGLYHLNVLQQALELVSPGSCGRKLSKACLGQEMAAECAAVFIWTAIPGRSTRKYRERAYRYMYMDAGHIGENLYLAAAALDLGCCTIGAFFDGEINALLGLDGEQETALYLGAVGPVL